MKRKAHATSRPARAVLMITAVTLVIVCGAAMSGCLAPFRRPAPSRRLQGTEPTITVFLHDKNQKTQMKLETYLEGVVAGEIGPSFPAEALAAQAILARTFTVQRIEQMGGTSKLHGTDVCTDPEHFQAYDASKISDAIRGAVRASRGQIVTSAGLPAVTFFHSNSGGMTATAVEGIAYKDQATPYLTPVKDVVKDTAPWTATFSTQEIMKALKTLGKQVTSVTSVGIASKGPSGRAVDLTVGNQAVSAPALRTALGPEKMRSTLLDSVVMSGGKVMMKGKGWGHGVGLSQEGAKVLAEQGKKAAEIIQYYYKGVTLTSRWK
ncbi:MAG: SpoIID/LytB domain-containing protein [Bacillota bacterium]|nr:SpoIID/LytB domain-containing protein [Bacillota bacterium]